MRAVAYLRISQDDTHEGLGVARQRRDAETVAASAGWDLVEVIEENDTSAFSQHVVALPNGRTVRRTVRPGFDRLLAGLRQRTWQCLIIYHLDRLARQPRDLEDVIELVEQDGLIVRAVSGPGICAADELSVQMARIMVTIANQASRDTSRRVRRVKAEQAAAGRPNLGRFRPFAFQRDGVTVIEEEAAVVRLITEQVLAGVPRAQVARNLNASGAPLRGGIVPWDAGTITAVIRNPRYAGLRAHRGEVVGAAAWPAIISLEEHAALLAVAAATARNLSPQAKASRAPIPSLLGGRLLTCGVCAGAMTSSRNCLDHREYTCRGRKHVTRSMTRLDAHVARAATAWLTEHCNQPACAELLGGLDPARAWTRWPLDKQRQVIAMAFERILVLPQGRIGDKFKPELIVLTYRAHQSKSSGDPGHRWS